MKPGSAPRPASLARRTSMSEGPGRGMALHTKILLGLVLGTGCGIAVNLTGEWIEAQLGFPVVKQLLTYVVEPVGQVFLNMLLMTVVPLVFASLATGVARLGDLRQLGRMGARTFAYFVVTMSLAVTIGLVLVNTV